MDVPAGGGYYAAPPVPPPATTGGLQENVASALCYALTFITGILFLVLEPYNKNRNIKFHAFQAIFLGVAMFVIQILLIFVHGISWTIGALLSPLVGLGFFVLWLFMMWKAYNNQKVVLPVIGDIAQKQAMS